MINYWGQSNIVCASPSNMPPMADVVSLGENDE